MKKAIPAILICGLTAPALAQVRTRRAPKRTARREPRPGSAGRRC
jgi:hypothetical protein